LAQLLERDKNQCRAVVQLLSDRNVAVTLPFEDICEYTADVSLDSFDCWQNIMTLALLLLGWLYQVVWKEISHQVRYCYSKAKNTIFEVGVAMLAFS